MMSENNNLSEALAVGHAIGERVGYFLDAHSAENHPGLLHEALCSDAADWFRNYSDLSKRLKEFKDKYRDVRKIIADNVCDGELKLVSNEDVKEYFLADSELKDKWIQHNTDVNVCFKLLKSYDRFNSEHTSNNNTSLLDFSNAYLKRLIKAAEEKFVPLYFDDTQTKVVEVIEDKVEKTDDDIQFELKHFRMIYIYYFDQDPYVPLTEPFYLFDDETVDMAVERFKRTWKGCYNEEYCITASDLIEFDKKVRVWAD